MNLYNVNFQSKNILNDTYGQFSYDNTNIIITDYPIAPNYTNSYNLHISRPKAREAKDIPAMNNLPPFNV